MWRGLGLDLDEPRAAPSALQCIQRYGNDRILGTVVTITVKLSLSDGVGLVQRQSWNPAGRVGRLRNTHRGVAVSMRG